MNFDLDIVCDICQIKMYAVNIVGNYFGRRKYDKKHRDRVLQFIKDHHGCDPIKGVRIIRNDTKFSFYTNVEGDTE